MKTSDDQRRYMEQAVDVMRNSVEEPRDDGKLCPRVGAVLVKPDGQVDTASRGELRQGDHAEFAVLERKNRDVRLDGSVLYTTLEPCAPGARRHPKLSCAERIVAARIAEVWVGIEDPDPTVDRRGIKFLQDSGVKVYVFERELQDIIRSENSEFLEQALKRAQAVDEPMESIVLSSLEASLPAVDIRDLSLDALEQYRKRAAIEDKPGTTGFNRVLVQQGLLEESDVGLVPTGFGLLLFGSHPRRSVQQSGMLGTIRYPDGREETEDFDGPMVLIPERVEKWLADKLPNVNDRTGMRRQSIPAMPQDMVREAVVNALVHRDYDVIHAKCQIRVDDGVVEVWSPGGPLEPITLERLNSFDAPMLSRNPSLHYVFAQMEMAEERGLGIKTLRERSEREGLPLPRYRFDDPYLVLSLFRDVIAAEQFLDDEARAQLTKDELVGWRWVSTQDDVTSAAYAKSVDIETRTAQRHLSKFVKLGLLEKVGSGPNTSYRLSH